MSRSKQRRYTRPAPRAIFEDVSFFKDVKVDWTPEQLAKIKRIKAMTPEQRRAAK